LRGDQNTYFVPYNFFF